MPELTMSARATNFVRRLRGLSPVEKAVAFVVGDHDNHRGGGSYPSMTTVAEEAGLQNRESASRIVTRLVNYRVILAPQPSRGRRPTVYFFNYDLTNCDSPVTVAQLRTVTPESQLTVTEKKANRDSEAPESLPTVTDRTANRDSPVTRRGLKGKHKGEEEAEGLATAATICSAFRELGYEEPFGDAHFQHIWGEEWNKIHPGDNGGGVDAMERTIRRCQKIGINVPTLFFQVKRKIETAELENRFGRTPL